MKNKKLLTAVLCISIGCIMLVATAFASSSGTTGYEAYKSALKATAEAKSFTAGVSVEVKDNDMLLGSADLLMKASGLETGNFSMNGTIKADSQEKSFEMYQQIGKIVIKTSDSDIYYVSSNDLRDSRTNSYDINHDPNAVKAGEAVVDALVGNLKDYFIVSAGADGGSTVDFHITGSQIPAVVNAVTSLCAKEKTMGAGQQTVNYTGTGMPPFMEGLHVTTPKLTDDVRVDEISISAEIDGSGVITSQTIQTAVSGKDADGNQHQVSVIIDMVLSGLGSTAADTIDLEGKQTQTVDFEKIKGPAVMN